MDTWLIENIAANIVVAIQSILLLICFFVIGKLLKIQKSHSKQLNQIKNELKAINSGNVGIGRKINLFSKEIANVELDKMTNAHAGTEEKSYQQASVLLKRGASVEEVVESCDIAPDEAELLSIMTHANEVSANENKVTSERYYSRELPIAS